MNNQCLIRVEYHLSGIPESMVEQMKQGVFQKSSEKNHIGMENAINRIRMYYGEEGQVRIESRQGEWTRVEILIPKIHGNKEE